MESLRELTSDEETECLLEALREDMPHSVHVLNMIATLSRWRRGGCKEVSFSILTPVEESDCGVTTVVIVLRMESAGLTPIVAVHSTEPAWPAGTSLHRLLGRTELVPWREDMLFESVHERCVPALIEVARSRGDPQRPPLLFPTDKMFLPKEQALSLDVSPSAPGLCVRPLLPEHACFVNENWPHKMTGTEKLLESTLRWNAGLPFGIFTEEEEKAGALPVAFVITKWYGGLGILHTIPSHRRQGLGSLVVRTACRALASRGLDVHCNIVLPNPGSQATLTGVGFKKIGVSFWIAYQARCTP